MNTIKLLLLFITTLFLSASYSQKMTIGPQVKSSDAGKPWVMKVDNSGIYVSGERLEESKNFMIGFWNRRTASMIKYDNELKKVYDVDYNALLKNKQFEKFIFNNEKLFLLASSREDKKSNYRIEYVEIDKSTGSFKGELKTLLEFKGTDNLDKKEKALIGVHYNCDSSKIIIAQSYESETENHLNAFILNPDLTIQNTIEDLKLSIPESFYELQDIIPLSNGNIIMEARILGYADSKKKDIKKLQLSHYDIGLYNNSMSLIKNIKIAGDQEKINILHSTIFLQDNELKQICFYSDIANYLPVGIIVNKINQSTGDIEVLDNKLLSETSVGPTFTDKKGNTHVAHYYQDVLQIRNISFNADKSINVVAQQIQYIKFHDSHSDYIQVNSINGNFAFFKINEKGKINWVTGMPFISASINSDILDLRMKEYNNCERDFFENKYRAEYVGNSVVLANNKLHIIVNDANKNIDIIEFKPNLQIESSLMGSCFDITVDLNNGAISRKILSSNKKLDTPIPAYSTVVGNTVYYIVRDMPGGFSKYSEHLIKLEF